MNREFRIENLELRNDPLRGTLERIARARLPVSQFQILNSQFSISLLL
jgi:hypothetical protein